MARKPRLHVPGALYHVISRGNNRQGIFRSEEDYREFLKHLERVKSSTALKLYAYCLMPNHFHLLCEVGEAPLSSIMLRILTGYTRYFNKTYTQKGHLFQGRYRAIICARESYLLELVRYIHLNPIRAKLVQRPSEWKWSGHGEYTGTGDRRILETGEVLSRFSGSRSTAVKGYMDFVRDGAEMGKSRAYYPEEKSPYLGDTAFVEDLKTQHWEVDPWQHRKESIPLEKLLEEVVRANGIPAETIRGDGRARGITGARKAFIQRAHRAGHKAISVARFLNCTDSYVARIYNE